MSTSEEIVDALVPVIEGVIARRNEEIYLAIEDLREQFQQTVNVMDENDRAIVGGLQELRGMVTGEGLEVAEVLRKSSESWQRFVVGEAELLGYKVLTPKTHLGRPVERIEVQDG